MRKITTGSGITRRTRYVMDGSMNRAEIELFKKLMGAAQGGVLKRIYDTASKTLTDASLPACPAVRYRKNLSGEWRRMPMLEAMVAYRPDAPFLRKWFEGRVYCWGVPSGATHGLVFLPAYVIDVRNYEPDSREGYAARMFDCLHDLRLAIECEDTRAIYGNAYQLGVLAKEASIKHQWESLALAAQASRRGASEGGIKGSATRKDEWDASLRRTEQAAKRLVSGGTPLHQLARAVSEATATPLRTVQRHLEKLKIKTRQ